MPKSPPLMGGDKGEGDQRFYHPHLTSPIKGEALYVNPAASYRELSNLDAFPKAHKIMREERLTERIRSWKQAPDRRGGRDPKRMIDSIIRHLERILNTRQGSVPIADDYGIPDFTDLSSGFSDALRDLERTIRNTIQKYEPRLKSVRVKLIPQEENTLAVSFQIVGQLILEEEKNPITFQSVMDSDGKFTIKA